MTEQEKAAEAAILDVLRYGPKTRTAIMNGLSVDHAAVRLSLALTRLAYTGKIRTDGTVYDLWNDQRELGAVASRGY